VTTGRVYPQTLDQQPPSAHDITGPTLSVSQSFTRQVLNLPLFFGITEEEQDRVCDSFRRVLLSLS